MKSLILLKINKVLILCLYANINIYALLTLFKIYFFLLITKNLIKKKKNLKTLPSAIKPFRNTFTIFILKFKKKEKVKLLSTLV